MRVFKIVHGDNRVSESDALENGMTNKKALQIPSLFLFIALQLIVAFKH